MRWRNWIFAIPLRLRSIFRRGRMDHELNEEFQFHLDCRMEAEMEAGKDPKEARRAEGNGRTGAAEGFLP